MRKYSTASNMFYTLKLQTQFDRRYPLSFLALLGLNLLLPVLATLLPTAAVAALTRGGSVRTYMAVVAGLMVLYAAAAYLQAALKARDDARLSRFYSECCMGLVLEKCITMDYRIQESPEGQQMRSAAINVAGNPAAGGIHGMRQQAVVWTRSLLVLALYGAAAASLDWRILLVMALMSAANTLAAGLVRRYESRTRADEILDRREYDYLLDHAYDPANGKDVRLYRMENWVLGVMTACFRRRWNREKGRFRRQILGDCSDSVFLVLRDLIAYTVLANAFLSGQMDAAGFTFSVSVIATLSAHLNAFFSTTAYLRFINIAFNDFRNFLEWEDPRRQGGERDVSQVRRPPRVELRNVTFSYPGQETPVIDQFSLTIQPGEKIALVGLNGAGKTTLVKLLSGLYLPDSGEILVDGAPLERFDAGAYFQLVGTVFQDVTPLPFTVGENIAGRETYDRDRAWKCLEMAGLREVVEALPRGLDTHLTQKMEREGVDLSGGQKQRLVFARALYKDAPLLILDEPTSALDPLAEADLYQKYARETADKTSVFISHRLSSTQFCDRVVYMENGRIAETGSHQELLERGGAYARLFQVQSSYYRENKEEYDEEI